MNYPIINLKMTGNNLKEICQDRNIAVKDIQAFLSLSCVHTVYKWFRGESLPSIDHLYALQELMNVSMSEMIVGNLNNSENRRTKSPKNANTLLNSMCWIYNACELMILYFYKPNGITKEGLLRYFMYYSKIMELQVT